MVLELLKRLEGGKLRVPVIEPDDEADIDPVRIEVINETAAIDAAIQRPADAMQNMAGFAAAIGQLPELLEPQAVSLWVAVAVQRKLCDQSFGQAAAATLGQHGQPAMNIDARCEVGSFGTIGLTAHVADPDANHAVVGAIEQFIAGEARENIDAQRLGLLRQPGA